MIHIITESEDQVSNEVIEYILANNGHVKRINSDIFLISLKLSNAGKLCDFQVSWHRRAFIQLNPSDIQKYPFINQIFAEEDVVNKFLEKKNLKNKYYYGGYIEESQHDKLYDLYLAKNLV